MSYKLKHIALTIRAEDCPLSDAELCQLLQDAFHAITLQGGSLNRRSTAKALEQESAQAEINTFDSRDGYPAFYIP